MSEPVESLVEEGVARLVLNRPEHGNAIDLPLAEALLAAAIRCDEDPAVRAVLLTANGKLFCAGGDLAGFVAHRDHLGAYLKRLTIAIHGALTVLSGMAKPLVTAINGPAAGGGLGLALLGDIVIAAESAHFTSAYTAIGLTPDCGASWLLPRLVGVRRAQEMVLTNRRVPAAEAAAIGLITRVVANAELALDAAETARKLAAGATAALGIARGLIATSLDHTLADQLDRESRAIAAAGGGPEAAEGVAAFLAKRTPDFRR